MSKEDKVQVGIDKDTVPVGIAQAYHKLLLTSSPQTLLLPDSKLHKQLLNLLPTPCPHSIFKLHQVLDICFGDQDTRWIQYQFEAGRMVGANLLFLDNNGFTDTVYDLLLTGTSTAEKSIYKLPPTQSTTGIDRFTQLKQLLKSISFGKRHQQTLFTQISALYHIRSASPNIAQELLGIDTLDPIHIQKKLINWMMDIINSKLDQHAIGLTVLSGAGDEVYDWCFHGKELLFNEEAEQVGDNGVLDGVVVRTKSHQIQKIDLSSPHFIGQGLVESMDLEHQPTLKDDPKKQASKINNDDIELGLFQTPKPKKQKLSGTRFRWLALVHLLTCLIPSFLLTHLGKMPLKSQQTAWREKVVLCFLILLLCFLVLFLIIGLGLIICPIKFIKSPGEISSYTNLNGGLVYMYGNYYDVGGIMSDHIKTGKTGSLQQAGVEETTLGKDVGQMFDRTNDWGRWCSAFPKPTGFRLYLEQDALLTNGIWVDHYTQISGGGDLFGGLKDKIKGTVVWIPSTLPSNDNDRYIIAYDRVYNIGALVAKDQFFMDNDKNSPPVQAIFNTTTTGQDITDQLQGLRSLDEGKWNGVVGCLEGLFYVGMVDHRKDIQCVAPNYLLLVASIILVSVIAIKFLAALQLTIARSPEIHEKFVILQVPCYTESEESLTRTLNSLACLDYDDKHKLIFVICDGMIIGTGNDRPTPRIVLDILGVDPTLDPPPHAFQSLGEGNRQLNFGKVYSGLYEIQGRAVPYVVVVKCGKPTERQKPGNRGKRDSQMLLMRFLSRVHFNQPFSPLELEIFHNIKNVIGVDPSFYEFILMVDADTEVKHDSMNRLVSCMSRDSRIMGICGETRLSNEKESWVTMIQVYEYFISHHLAKAFESLFGSVTCLPGCFTLYRLRSPIKNTPLLISPQMVADYSENKVDTLHMKNLLHLGEDRYLTTLMMKHFPNMRTKFTPDAQAKTVAPGKLSVILSQRRRWINSTVHNLLELMFLPDLCGFCLFSMRFVVFIDLFATIVQPATLLYVVWLIFVSVYNPQSSLMTNFPLISIILIAAVYGFQVVIFIVKREWQHIGWMFFYILAIPIYGFWLPIYSFWHFDDFSWGSTRRVVGDDKKTKYVVEVEEEFDPASIPHKSWNEYEQERLEKASNASYSTYGSSSFRGSSYSSSSVSSSTCGNSIQRQSPPSPFNYPSNSPPSAYNTVSSYSVSSPIPSPYNAFNNASTYTTSSPTPPYNAFKQQNRTSTAFSTSSRGSWVYDPNAPMPTDEEILEQVGRILSTSDLMRVTKKSVRRELTRVFNRDMEDKKEFIHRCIEEVLKR